MDAGTLIAYVGAMGSGKTEKLISLYEEVIAEGLNVLVFKPFVAREGEKDDFVYSRNGRKVPAISVDTLEDIPEIAEKENAQVILIDEIQFFEEEYPEHVLEGIAMSGIEVYVFGLDVTSDNETFGNVGNILAHADEVHKIRTSCHKCGGDARISKYTKGQKTKTVQVGDLGDYEPTCRSCYYSRQEYVKQLNKKVSLTIGDNEFYFSANIDSEVLENLGYDVANLGEQVTDINDVMELIYKLKRKE